MIDFIAIEKKSSIQLLVWELNGELFGTDTEFCLETKTDIEIFPVPHSKPHIAGIANLRGEICLVYDLGILFGKNKRSFQNRELIIRVKMEADNFSIIADSIIEVMQESNRNFKDANSYLSKEKSEFTSHILDSELGLIQILNLEKIYNA